MNEKENIWRDFAKLNGMTIEEFESEILAAAQAILAIQVGRNECDQIRITSRQNDGEYSLVFTKVSING